jgi:hypothetical protein
MVGCEYVVKVPHDGALGQTAGEGAHNEGFLGVQVQYVGIPRQAGKAKHETEKGGQCPQKGRQPGAARYVQDGRRSGKEGHGDVLRLQFFAEWAVFEKHDVRVRGVTRGVEQIQFGATEGAGMVYIKNARTGHGGGGRQRYLVNMCI